MLMVDARTDVRSDSGEPTDLPRTTRARVPRSNGWLWRTSASRSSRTSSRPRLSQRPPTRARRAPLTLPGRASVDGRARPIVTSIAPRLRDGGDWYGVSSTVWIVIG